jgi:hypothetical protein
MTTLSLESILLHYTDATKRLAGFPHPVTSSTTNAAIALTLMTKLQVLNSLTFYSRFENMVIVSKLTSCMSSAEGF